MNEVQKYLEYTIPREDSVYCVEFCSSENCSQLLGVGTEAKVSIYQLKFKDDDDDVDDFEFEQLYDFQNGCRVTAIAWSPESSLVSLPKLLSCVPHTKKFSTLLNSPTNELLLKLISVLCGAMRRTVEKQLVDFLDGGRYAGTPSKSDLQRTHFSHVTNLGCEHHFGDLDSSQRRRPNASFHHHSMVVVTCARRIWLRRSNVNFSTPCKEEPKKKRKNKPSDKPESEPILNSTIHSFHVNDYVAIAYQDAWYPGCVEEVDETTAVVNFMAPCRTAGMFMWPARKDAQKVNKEFILLAVAGSDRRIRVFSTDLKGDDSVQVLEGHTDFVNSLTFDPDSGTQLASVGDDQWCRIWDRDGNQQLAFPLGAPGMSVCWHREEPMKVMVALKTGVIKIFSLTQEEQLMSFEAGPGPLMEADWSAGNKGLLIGAACGQDRPVERRQIHVEGTRHFRWAKCSDSLVATVGRPGRQIKVFNSKHQQTPITISQPITYTVSWHQRLPVLAAGGDQKVHGQDEESDMK
ncbi:LOW QUALITY PROTEIN: NUP37-like protein, partial [Mya arenaria]